jgi:hypothetical protein
MPPHQPSCELLGYVCWCGAAVDRSLVMSVLAYLIFKLANLFFSFGVADAVTFLYLVAQVFSAPFTDFEVGIRELVPMLLDIGC